MDDRNVVEVVTFALKESLTDLASDLDVIAAACANRKGHQEVRGMPHPRMKPFIPLRRKPTHDLLDLLG